MGDENKQLVLAQFTDIVRQPVEKCRAFLEATNWQLEDAVQLFFAGGMDSLSPGGTPPSSGNNRESPLADGEELVRPPLPVKREALFQNIDDYNRALKTGVPEKPIAVDAFRDYKEETKYKSGSGGGSSTDASAPFKPPTLASIYRPPLEINFEGTLEQAKVAAIKARRWLLVNVQSHTEFASHMLNRDTWSHDAVKDTIGSTFIFWQIYDDSDEGDKVFKYYHLKTLPAILVLDPQSGKKMKSWAGMVDAEQLLEDLLMFIDTGPMEQDFTPKRVSPSKMGCVDADEDEELQKALAASLEEYSVKASEAETKPRFNYPPLPDEPGFGESSSCGVGVLFPNGSRGRRRYYRSDPLSVLWSYCCENVKEAAEGRKFRFTHIHAASKTLEYDPEISIEEAGVANATLVMVWD